MKGQRLTLLRIYLDDREQGDDHEPLGVKLLETAFDDRIAGATMFRSESGVGRSRRVRQVRNEWDLDHLPIVVQIADTDAKIDVFYDAHAKLLDGHLTTRETVWFVHRAGSRELPGMIEDLPSNSRPKLVRMFCNRGDISATGANAVEAATEAVAPHSIFHMALTGIEGFGSHRVMHHARLFHRDRSMPVMISALCTAGDLDALVTAAVAAHSGLTITVESVTQISVPHSDQA